MIVDERLVTYINSLDTGNTSILDQIEKEALDSYVPIIRKCRIPSHMQNLYRPPRRQYPQYMHLLEVPG